MNCPYCGASLRLNARFCNQCGRSQTGAAAAVAVPPPATAPTAVPERATVTPAGPVPIEQQPTALITPQPAAPLSSNGTRKETEDETDISAYPTQLLTGANTLPPVEAATAPDTTQRGTLATTPPVDRAEPTSVPEPDICEADQSPTELLTGPAPSPGPSPAAEVAQPTAPLAADTIIGERYRVEALVRDEGNARVYRVISTNPPAICWSCGVIRNREADDRFCEDCGADLVGHEYLLRETPLTPGETAAPDEAATSAELTSFIVEGRRYQVELPVAEVPLFPYGVHLDVAGLSDVGRERASSPNEDSILLLYMDRVHESLSQPMGVFVVADGMGGHASGQEASRIAISAIARHMLHELLLPTVTEREAPGAEPGADAPAAGKAGPDDAQTDSAASSDRPPARALLAAISKANEVLTATNAEKQSDMGCTVTAATICGDAAYIANVGDSRTYLLTSTELRQLTADHSLVAQLVAGGLITPDEIYTHPQRSQIFRSLGDRKDMQIDLFVQQLQPRDRLLLCSDGLWEMVRDEQIETILRNARDVETACRELVAAANANGGEDNISVIVVEVVP